jgi:class 3 adenylate cyclase
MQGSGSRVQGSGSAEPGTPNPEPRPDGERRQLTVRFCDLVGSTEIASQLDPEEWGDIAGRYQRTAAEAVTRFGAHVANTTERSPGRW